MIFQEIKNTFSQVFSTKLTSISAIFVTIFTLIFAFYSPIAALILYLNYLLGYLLCWCLIKYNSKTKVYFQRLSSFYQKKSTRKIIKPSCSICDDLSCQRHKIKNAVPWKNFYIDAELNAAVEKFYNRIIENFILTWYNQFTVDNDFILQLKYCLRYATATIATRILEIDVSNVIVNKLVPCVIRHIDDYMYMQQIVKLKNVRFNDVIVEYLGKRLHAATVNRKYELTYLQHLVSGLMQFALPDSYLKCKNFSVLIREILAGWVFLPLMDVLADPNILNWLIVHSVNFKSIRRRNINQEVHMVEFLSNFEVHNIDKKSSFYMGLPKIQSDPQMFYFLMQFLKKHDAVHLLQFCLNVDEFNKLLLKPDLNKQQLEELHTEAQKLYSEYLDLNSVNFIGCSLSVSDAFHSLIKEGVHSVANLRTSDPLFQAYEHTINVIENVWLPQFFHSSEFYSHICGSKVTSNYDKSSKNSPLHFGSPLRTRKYDPSNQSSSSKIGFGFGKIKGALKAHQPIEGSLYPEAQNLGENGTVDDLILETENIFRDLSSWRICITDFHTSPSNKDIFFRINIQRLDAVPDETRRSWDVLRKEHDFFLLKSKLVEFHGEHEISDSPLPSRKTTSLESKRDKYETFIRKLLQKPSLRGSDLLYTFLTAEDDFSDLLANSTPVGQELGNIYQSVAHKLRKEKGQNLDAFMTAFLNSTGKSKQGKFDWADETDVLLTKIDKAPAFPKTFRNHIFNDNFGVTYHSLKEGSSGSYSPAGITESIFYLLRYIFKIPHGLLKFYVIICNICQPFIEMVCKLFVQRKLKSGLSQQNLAYLIGLLEDVIFQSHISPTKEELKARKAAAFKQLEGIIHPMVNKTLFNGNLTSGLTVLLEIFQNPHYNKHLVYNLLDVILLELYPAIQKSTDE